MVFYAEKHDLFDGAILLYRRRSGGKVHLNWQMRLKLVGNTGYVVRSCKTKNYEEAYGVAWKNLLRLQHRVEEGLPIEDWTFTQHWQNWFDRKVGENAWRPRRERWQRERFNLFFSRYFGDKPLREITAEFAHDYWAWRLRFWDSPEGLRIRKKNPARLRAKTRGTMNFRRVPANKTLEMEQSTLNEVFAYAAQRKRTEFKIRLKAPKPSRLDARRPGFDHDEWKVLAEHLHKWAECEPPYQSDSLNAFHRLRRQQLLAYVHFLASSGLRPGEANAMRWEDITEFKDRDGRKYLQVKVRRDTKTGRSRIVVPMLSAGKFLADWWVQVTKQLPSNAVPGLQELVWRGASGTATAPTDLNKSFQKFLAHVPYTGRKNGLLCDADGVKRTLYSLRHTYATTALLQGLTELEVSDNMGTEVVQIQKHYSHVKNTDKAEKLSAMRLPGPEIEFIRIRIREKEALPDET